MPDGSYVDRKSQMVAEAYEKNLAAKRATLESETSDLTSRRELTMDEYTDLFIQSTIVDGRGQPYGVGSLSESLGKRKYPGSSSESYQSLKQQLEEAQHQIEAQNTKNAELEAELARQAAEQQGLRIVEKYLRNTDPRFLDFVAAESEPPPQADPPAQADPESDPTRSS